MHVLMAYISCVVNNVLFLPFSSLILDFIYEVGQGSDAVFQEINCGYGSNNNMVKIKCHYGIGLLLQKMNDGNGVIVCTLHTAC